MKPKKIVFLGLFGQQNLGNECTLQAMVYHARQRFRDAEIKCVCTGPEDTLARHGIPSFDMYAPPGEVKQEGGNKLWTFMRKAAARAWRESLHGFRAFKILQGSDMLIVPGTGLLVDHSTGFGGYPYYVFKWLLIAWLCRCKVFIVSIGAGPIYHPISKFLVRRALSLAHYRSFRDGFSREYIEGIGFKAADDPVYPDLAFSLPQSVLPKAPKRGGLKPVVGVGLIDYYGQGSDGVLRGRDAYRDYIGKTGGFIQWLVENEYDVRLLIGDVEYDTAARKVVLEDLENRGIRLGDGRVVSEPIDSVEDLLSQLAETDIVISPRFHNIILALMLKKKTISLSYNEKFEALMAEFELREYCQRLDQLEVERLIEQVASIQKYGGNLGLYIRRKADEYRRALDQQYQMIFDSEEASEPGDLAV